MLSFVVQNFYSTPFLPKTQRYNKLIIANNTQLLHLFIKDNLRPTWLNSVFINTYPPTVFLYNRMFTKRFYKFFKPLYTKHLGIMTLNLTKSSMYRTFNDLNNLISLNKPLLTVTKHTFTLYTVKYLQPITLVTFAFQKTTYNTLMIYILFLLTNSYSPSQNAFKLYYSFIIQPTSWAVYPFLNLFYFKVRQF